jgi:hypothetical protein
MIAYRYEDMAGAVMTVDSSTHATECARVVLAGAAVYIPATEVPAVCAAMREAAGLPPVWTVEKLSYNEALTAHAYDNGVRSTLMENTPLTPDVARRHAMDLLAAADEAEARANRPKLPTAQYSVVCCAGDTWVLDQDERGVLLWMRPGARAWATAEAFRYGDFTVLYDPDQTPGGAP